MTKAEKRKAYNKRHYKEHREEFAAAAKKRYEEHKEEYRLRAKRYYKEHKEKLNDHSKEWNKKNPDYYKEHKDNPEYKAERNAYAKKHYEKVKNDPEYKTYQYFYNAKWRQDNREKYNARAKKWVKENKVERKAYVNERARNKRKVDPMFRLNENMSRAIWSAIKSKKNGQHWEDLVGYALNQLKTHLESLFLPGMTWNNHGRGPDKWHIDHIIAKYWWKFDKPEDREFQQCWALCNLQPLWEPDNLSKGNRI